MIALHARVLDEPVEDPAEGVGDVLSLLIMDPVKVARRRGYTRLSTKLQVTLPLSVVRQLELHPGDELKVEAEEGRVVLSREPGRIARRLAAIREAAGSMPGVWEPGDLERLRDEWR